jgi:hypothetical protein
MFKRSLLISTLALCASVSFAYAQAVPSAGAVSALSTCSSDCVSEAQSLVDAIDTMPAGPEKDRLLLSLVKAVGTLAIANPALSAALGGIAASAQDGLSPAAAVPFVAQVVAALNARNPGAATAALGEPSLGDDPAS